MERASGRLMNVLLTLERSKNAQCNG